MRKLLFTLLIGSSSLVFGDYTIQVISAQKSSSITPAFNKKIKDSKMQKSQKKEGRCNVVTVGKYKNATKAKADLNKAKTIASDAFVRPVNRKTPAVCDTNTTQKETKVENTKTATIADTKTESVTTKTIVVDSNITTKAPASISTATLNEEPKNSETLAESSKKSSEAIASIKADNIANATVYVYDKNLARKSDISEAIEYYKNSPYHSFKPMR